MVPGLTVMPESNPGDDEVEAPRVLLQPPRLHRSVGGQGQNGEVPRSSTMPNRRVQQSHEEQTSED